MKKLSYFFLPILLGLTACEYNEQFKGLNTNPTPVDIKTLEYTMADDDYAAVASNTTNTNLANERNQTADLNAVKTQNAFSPSAKAADYAPAFLATKWPTADPKSAVKLTYNYKSDLTPEMHSIAAASIYSVTNNDYLNAWNGDSVFFFTPQTAAENSIPTILKQQKDDADSSTVVMVSYLQAETEPTAETTTEIETENLFALYQFDGSKWVKLTNYLIIQPADFEKMGLSYPNFSATAAATNYLPRLLAQLYPFAQQDNEITVVYQYYASSVTSVHPEKYLFDGNNWGPNNYETITDQFVKINSGWKYDPSVTLNLPAIRNNAFISSYYQAVVDWVWENIDQKLLGLTVAGTGYTDYRMNAEFYTGSSAYYNNVDMRPSKARSVYPAGYEGKTDEEITALMTQRLCECWAHGLETMHPDAKPVDGIEVIYTVNLAVYTGVNVTEPNYTMQFKLVGVGKFEYIEGSFKEL